MTLPHVAMLVGCTLSFGAWALPAVSSAGKGFVAPPASGGEVLRTVGAYLAVAACCAVGFYGGKSLGRRLPRVSGASPISLHADSVWTIWIALAAIGVGAATAKIIGAMGLRGCLLTLASFNANAFKAVIYTDYSVGMMTLRYVAILAAAVAIFRYLAFKELSIRGLVSVCFLLIVALISSRLSIIWAGVIGGMMYLLVPDDTGKRRIAMPEYLAGAAAILVLLGALTISRTFGYYQQQGADTVFAAVGSEFQRYLAAPFQGSIDAVNYPQRRTRLSDQAGIDGGLTTNSSLVELAEPFGRWNVVALAMLVACGGFACGLLHRFRETYLIAVYGILQCCHLEIWRLMMYQRGITITLVLIALSVSVMLATVRLPAFRIPTVRVRLR